MYNSITKLTPRRMLQAVGLFSFSKNFHWLLLVGFGLIFSTNTVSAQRTCGTTDLHEQMMTNPKFQQQFQAKKDAVAAYVASGEKALCADPVILPMAVHYSGLGALSAADEACLIALAQDQIQILNDDYQGTNADITNWNGPGGASANYPGVNHGETCIQFCLATLNHPAGYGLNNGDFAVTFNQVTGDNDANWAGYINIWVKSISALGYSPLGGSGNGDGVAVDIEAFGSGAGCAGTGVVPSAPYNHGRTLTHELGHYLLLDHIWGGGCASDDGIADTPDAQTSNYGCPASSTSSCSSLDLHMNYMDYTNDLCMYMFSAGQSTVMEGYVNTNLAAVAANTNVVCRNSIGFVASNSSQMEGSANCSGGATHTIPIELEISSAPLTNVTATLSIDAASTATNSSDYQNFSTTVVFPAGSAANQTVNLVVYEDAYVESDENLIINLVSTSDPNYAVGDRNQHTHFISNDDSAPVANVLTTLLNEDFNSGMGSWTTTDGGTTGNSWNVVADYGANDLNGTNFAFVDSDAAGNGSTSYETLTSPVMNADGFTSLDLTFDQYFRAYTQGYVEQINIEVYDGTTWQNVYSASGNASVGSWANPDAQSIDILAYANPNLQVRFIYDAEWDYYWAIDNVKIEGIKTNPIQSAANSGGGFAEHDLGPNATVHFYDVNTGSIMATIENLSSHDYGCTKVEVSNAGTGSYPSNDAMYEDLTDKNFLITPEFNNVSGTYNITLYYTAAEINGWVSTNTDGDPASDLMMLKSSGNISSATAMEAMSPSPSAFGADWAYVGSYSTGFSGLALGNMAAALPVEWLAIHAAPTDNHIEVTWSTAEEINNKGFHIQRRTDGKMDNIGWVEPNEYGQYIFVDKNVRAGMTYYYQILQEDWDGETNASVIVSAKIKEETPISIHPNPFKNELVLTGNVSDEMVEVVVFDVLGQQVYQTMAQSKLDLAHLERGIYIVHLTGANGVPYTHRVVKQ